MRLTRAEARQLALPALAAIVMAAGGAMLIHTAGQSVQAAQRSLGAAQAERKQNTDRLARIAEEEREVKEDRKSVV